MENVQIKVLWMEGYGEFDGMSFTPRQMIQVLYGIGRMHEKESTGGYCKVKLEFPHGYSERFDCSDADEPHLQDQMDKAIARDRSYAIAAAQSAYEAAQAKAIEAIEAAQAATDAMKQAEKHLNERMAALGKSAEPETAAAGQEEATEEPADEVADKLNEALDAMAGQQEEAAKEENLEPSNDFVVGSAYVHGWAGDSTLFSRYTVIKRTKCFVWLRDYSDGAERKCKVERHDGVEQCSPLGRYSMSPLLRASNLAALQS